jgi:hypothetical protein
MVTKVGGLEVGVKAKLQILSARFCIYIYVCVHLCFCFPLNVVTQAARIKTHEGVGFLVSFLSKTRQTRSKSNSFWLVDSKIWVDSKISNSWKGVSLPMSLLGGSRPRGVGSLCVVLRMLRGFSEGGNR